MNVEVNPGRGRPRRARTDEQILQATRDLFREHGPDAVSIAAVSAHSGVARTTIYRRFEDRRALLSAALRPVTAHGRPHESFTTRQRLEWVLSTTDEVLTRGVGLGGVAALLTDSDPEFSSVLRHSLAAGLQPVLDQITSDVARGELADDLDPDFVLTLVLGAHLAETLRRGTPPAPWRKRSAALLSRLLTPSDSR